MKIFSLLVLALALNLTVKAQRCSASVLNCNSIAVLLEQNGTKPMANTSITFSLEKELLPGVWEKVKEVSTSSFNAEFNKLDDGIYRVTSFISSNLQQPQKYSKIVSFKDIEVEGNLTNRADGYISNLVKIKKCVHIEQPNRQIFKEQAGISIRPTPASSFITIESVDKIAFDPNTEVVITNIQGQIVKQEQLPLDSHIQVIDLTSLNEGLYFLKIQGSNRCNIAKKLIVQR